MKISIIAGTFTGNRGAEAMLTTVIGEFRARYQNIQFHVFSYYPSEDKKLVNDPDIYIHSSTPAALVARVMPGALLYWICSKLHIINMFKRVIPSSVLAIKESSAMIDLAGVSFVDSRIKFLPFNMFTLLPAVLCGTLVVKFSQAIGPVKHPLNRFAAWLVLRNVKRVYARGEQTMAFLQDANLSETIICRADDVAFSHKKEYSLTTENQKVVEITKSKILTMKSQVSAVVGICPSAVIASKAQDENWNYNAFLCQIIIHLVNRGCGVVLFPNATRQQHIPQLRNNDLTVIDEVIRYIRTCRVNMSRIAFVNYDVNTVGIKDVIKCCDVTIVSRFHAMIASLSLEKPLLVMGWGHKYCEVMQIFGLEKQVFDYRRCELPHVLQRIDALQEDRRRIEESIRSNLADVCMSSKRQFEETFQWLEKNEKPT